MVNIMVLPTVWWCEQGPNYALAKRIQQWRAILAPSSRTACQHQYCTFNHHTLCDQKSITQAAFRGASLFDVEAFSLNHQCDYGGIVDS